MHCTSTVVHVLYFPLSNASVLPSGQKEGSRLHWVVPKGLLTVLGFLYTTQSLVPDRHFRNISGHLFTWLVCGSFQWRHGLLFTDCIVWDDKDKVTGFKRSHWIYLGRWRTGSPKLQLFQLSQHSYVTSCELISSSAYFSWSMSLKYKMQLSEGSLDKILHSKSRIQCFWRDFFFWRFVSRSDKPMFQK